MIKFGQFNFNLKRPTFARPNITKKMVVGGFVCVALVAVSVISIKQYFELQDSARALTVSEGNNKRLNSLLADVVSGRAEDKVNFEKEKKQINDDNDLKVAAFAKQAASCDEIKKKLKLKN